ncbi:CaiB/BaiF CoA-transferase family protein [Dactylosporangium sp. NPDC000555]|uniref:CaiB/BaiF CoA transferase family protein n=1 Tax=Dactylosporangium sp. NPDC000555 TaxID=3154260 RepID=UPI0033347382
MIAGALSGVRVVHLAAAGPIPLATMLLADLGADVVRIDRAAGDGTVTGLASADDPRTRGQRGIGLDVKQEAGRDLLLRLLERADVFLEGMRPGVAERLGIGPQECLRRNPRLVYGRMTGWGQTGPLAHAVGHDLNYLSIAGALHPMGARQTPPPVPLNLVADFGGGGLYLAVGVLAALVERASSGQGQVVDAAMVDGVASMTGLFHAMRERGMWNATREDNLLDGGAPFYRTYATGDGGFMAVGALEPQFYAALLGTLGLDPADWPQHDRSRWPAQRAALAEVFAARTRQEWTDLFKGVDACVTPVLSLAEAAEHPHLRERATFVDVDGLTQPAPAPRLSRTPATIAGPRVGPRAHTAEVLAELGLDAADVGALREQGVVG